VPILPEMPSCPQFDVSIDSVEQHQHYMARLVPLLKLADRPLLADQQCYQPNQPVTKIPAEQNERTRESPVFCDHPTEPVV